MVDNTQYFSAGPISTSQKTHLGGARRPWGYGSGEREYDRRPEPDRECFTCQVPGGCNKKHKLCALKEKRGVGREERKARFMALYREGKTDLEISRALGLQKTSVQKQRSRLGLEPNGVQKKGRS